MKYNDFSIIEQLGEGGNAIVHLVENPLHFKCAIKKLINKSAEKKQRFINEISIIQEWATKIKGIIPLYEYSQDEYWYTMPIATPVIRYITENKLTLRQIIDHYIKLCQTISELHKNHVSHRDIKPDNIYFFNDRFYIGDFGLVDFPDNDNNLTRSDRGIGAIFTIAPEMKRNPLNADGKKGDVYSLAKTLWMLLSLNEKGFDGQYNYFDKTHSLNQVSHVNKYHTIEIEELIRISTSNNPEDRPTIDDFISHLELWKSVVSDYDKQQKSQWAFLYKHILNNSGESVVWRNNHEIIDILNKISALNAYNHMFYPDGGGQDFRFAAKAPEANGIEIWDDIHSCNIVFPKALHFESFPDHEEWNYFLLELSNTNKIFGSELYYEQLVEDTPGHYVESTYVNYGVYDYDKENKYPDNFRLVSRYTGGKFLFVLKNGPYNSISCTYDARHNACSCEEFRDYIITLINQSSNNVDLETFFNSSAANINPFVDKTETETTSETLKQMMNNRTISREKYLSFKFNFYDYEHPQEFQNAKYYISFHSNDGTFNLNFNEKRLCVDGYLHELDYNDFQNVLFFDNRELAHIIKDSCKEQLFPPFEKEIISYFQVNIICVSKPTHLFSKNEIKCLMKNADDRVNNTLVIDENGYPRIISNNEFDLSSFPVRHETWNAYNSYVGKYSNLSTLDETYITSLHGWLSFLKSKKSVYIDYLPDFESEQELITKIEAIQ